MNAPTNTHTPVLVTSHAPIVGRKHEAFSDDENRILRGALKKLKEQEGFTQVELGDIVGSTQQNIQRLLNFRSPGGMGRPTANALARYLGFRDAEHLLLEAGVLANMTAAPTGSEWVNRDRAAAIARTIGIAQVAIEDVIARYTDSTARTRPIKWWVIKFGEAERDLPVPEPKPAKQARKPKRKSG